MTVQEVKVKKVHRGFYKVYNKETNKFLGQLENGKETGATESGEWIAFDSNGDWIGTSSTKWELVEAFKWMELNKDLINNSLKQKQ
tara:strand:+ start:76 stop:333 length:258 start_codon:yes stop_codon:yes gene_type:complete